MPQICVGCRNAKSPADGSEALKDLFYIGKLVAGAHSHRNLSSDSENKGSMVAGARSHRYLVQENLSKTAISKGTANIFLPLFAAFGLERISKTG